MIKLLVVFGALVAVSQAALVKRAAQSPGVWSALDQLRGKTKLSIEDIRDLLVNSKPGQDYPNLNEIPAGNFDCTGKKGFYADIDTKCQVIRRCDINGNQSAYLCPNLTIFNQITLVCHYFWEVDCSKAMSFYEYSNSRLYQGSDVPLLDNEDNYVVAEALGAVSRPVILAPVEPAAPKKKKSQQ